VFLIIALVMAFIVSASAPFLNGDAVARRVLYSGMASIVLTSCWLMWEMRRDEGYTVGRALATAYGAVYGALCGIYFFGPFSPAPVVLPFGLFFFSLSQSFRGTLSVYLLCASGELALALWAMFDATGDRGLVRATALARLDQLLIVGLVQVILLATFVLGRASRRATLKAVEQHDRVLRNLAQREALLAEARQELDRALRAGGVGRYTERVVGSFRLGKLIGSGAMGEVYEATQLESGRAAAVKLLRAELLRSADSIRRFAREAQVVASLDVPHVVQVLEICELDAALPYIAMERLEGTDLAERLRKRSRLSLKETARLARDVARGLEAARSAGIVHRDLKPANLFHARRADGRRIWKILDFGVSKLVGSLQGTLTREHALVGTPEYMAPEQPLGRPVTHQTDIHALGVICYRALTGRPAFTGEALMETVYSVVNHMPPRPTALQPELPEGVDAVLAVAMAKAPEDRFHAATELAAALRAVSKGDSQPKLAQRAARLAQRDPWGTAR
jgi:tRNA A-37 threonylcarbamoyl transferase component Bud32